MMAFIYNSALLPVFCGSLQVRFALIPLLARSVVESSIATRVVYMKHLNVQSFRFLSQKNRTLIHFSSSELRSYQFLDSLGGISSRFDSVK